MSLERLNKKDFLRGSVARDLAEIWLAILCVPPAIFLSGNYAVLVNAC